MTEQKTDDLKAAFEAAEAKMTNRALADRVRVAHPHAANSKEGIDAMVADYDRLVKESENQGSGQPMKTTG